MPTTFDLKDFNKPGSGNIYEAVMVAAKRARHIHNKMNEELRKKLGEIENGEDLDEQIVDREKIVKEYDKYPKPSQMAIEEYLNNKLKVTFEDDTK